MTKRNYEQFAEMLRVESKRADNAVRFHRDTSLDRRALDQAMGWQDGVIHLATEIADIFQSENPRFNRDRFFQAVGGSK